MARGQRRDLREATSAAPAGHRAVDACRIFSMIFEEIVTGATKILEDHGGIRCGTIAG
jgi:hypothetical protein